MHQYIVQSRVALAKRCLMTGLSVTETSLACGYTSLSHFCRLFKKQTGLTPGDYASQVKKDR
ncbi:MAG: AraC family transcriptional regulator [Clostridia bacterium]|nr:AraC family transcriptional regulator [Clostridia bacterium]